jgi:hypothetical protein
VGLYVSLLTYRGGRDDKPHTDAFQALRQNVLSALATAAPALRIRGVEAAGNIAPYLTGKATPTPTAYSNGWRLL